MTTRTWLGWIILAAVLFAAGLAVGTQWVSNLHSQQTNNEMIYRCISTHQNLTDKVCVTYEQNRQTGVAEPVYLQPGQTLDEEAQLELVD